MLKQIPVSKLRPGMYIHRIDAPWLDHPFWKKRFLLEKYTDLQTIRANDIETVWINTEKGLDVLPDQDESEQDSFWPAASIAQSHRRASREQEPAPSTLEAEYRHALELCAEAQTTIKDIFLDAREGLPIDPDDARSLVSHISQSVERNPSVLISLTRMRTADEYTYMHSVAVCALMAALARTLGLNEAEQREAATAGLLHDVGKMAIPIEILNKPGRLTDDEFRLIMTHPDAGYVMLMRGGLVPNVALDVCLHHHEKFDGSGYPHGLQGDGISLQARMGALCDVYDAVTSDRPYKKGWNPAEAIHRMAQWTGHFDPMLLRAFVRTVGLYPVGSLVLLQGGELAVVTEQHPHELLLPKVRLLEAPGNQTRKGRLIDLSTQRGHNRIRSFAPQPDWEAYGALGLWLPEGVERRNAGAATAQESPGPGTL